MNEKIDIWLVGNTGLTLIVSKMVSKYLPVRPL